MRVLNPLFRSVTHRQMRIVVHVAGAVVAGLIVLAGYSLSFTSQTTNTVEWQRTIESGAKLLQRRGTIAAEREQAKRELSRRTSRLDELNALIPHSAGSSRFLAQLSELARQSELNIDNFRPGKAEETDDLQRIRVQLSGVGRYEGICHFIHGLHSLPRLTHVGMLKINPADAPLNYAVQLELSIYFAEDDTVLTRVALND